MAYGGDELCKPASTLTDSVLILSGILEARALNLVYLENPREPWL